MTERQQAVAPIIGAGAVPHPQDSQNNKKIGFIDSMFNMYMHNYEAVVRTFSA